MSDLVICKHREEYGYTWQRISLLRSGVITQHNTQTHLGLRGDVWVTKHTLSPPKCLTNCRCVCVGSLVNSPSRRGLLLPLSCVQSFPSMNKRCLNQLQVYKTTKMKNINHTVKSVTPETLLVWCWFTPKYEKESKQVIMHIHIQLQLHAYTELSHTTLQDIE